MAKEATMKFLSRIKNLKIVIKASKPGAPGKTIEFSGYNFETTDKEIAAAIRKNSMFGIDIFEEKRQEEKQQEDKKE